MGITAKHKKKNHDVTFCKFNILQRNKASRSISILTHYNTTFMNSFVSFTRIQQCKPTPLHSFSQTQKPSTAQSLPPNQDHSSLEKNKKNKRNVHNAYECLKMSSTIENNVCVSI